VPLTAVTGSVARCPWRQRGLTRQLPSRRGRAGGRSCSPPRPRRTLARPARAAPAAPLPPGWDAACPCCFVVPSLQTADFKRSATAHLDTIFSPFLLLTQVCVGGCLPAAAPQRRGWACSPACAGPCRVPRACRRLLAAFGRGGSGTWVGLRAEGGREWGWLCV